MRRCSGPIVRGRYSISTEQPKTVSTLNFEDTCWVDIDHSKLLLWLLVRKQRCPTRSLYRTHLAAFQIEAVNHAAANLIEERALGGRVILRHEMPTHLAPASVPSIQALHPAFFYHLPSATARNLQPRRYGSHCQLRYTSS
jgi:hypothetical protein